MASERNPSTIDRMCRRVCLIILLQCENLYYINICIYFFRLIKLFDCMNEVPITSWKASGEVERVLWNHYDENYCIVCFICV